jgi:hypothetical protein
MSYTSVVNNKRILTKILYILRTEDHVDKKNAYYRATDCARRSVVGAPFNALGTRSCDSVFARVPGSCRCQPAFSSVLSR